MSKQVALRILMLPALLSATGLAPATVFAEGGQINIQSDLEYIYSDIESKNRVTGERTDSTYSYFKQKYDIDILKELFPYLYFRAGGRIELVDSKSETEGVSAGFEEKADRLFAELDWRNPLYTASATYRKTNFEFDPREGSSTTLSREEYSGLWKWRPVGLPSVDLDFNRFHTWDDDGTRDSVVKLLVAKTRYNYEDFFADYTYTRNDEEQTIDVSGPGIGDTGEETDRTPIDSGSLIQIHNGGVRYTQRFLGDRLEVTGGARVNYDKLEPSGTGPIRPPTISTGTAFFLLDDTDPSTLTVVDAANPLSLVNIGLNAPMDPVGFGLDFGLPTEIDTLYVFPVENAGDPTLSSPGEIAAVAGSFNWEVFSSDDRLNWTQHIVTSARYSVLDNRFEISFTPAAESRYIKVVTTPLFNATGEIRISELQGFTTFDASPDLKFENTTQTYNLGLRWAATDRTTAAYEGFLRVLDSKPFDRDRTTLINGVSLAHEFNQMFYGDLRVLRTDTEETERDDIVRHVYSASLTGDYLPTLDQTLVYSGFHDKVGERSAYGNAIVLRTNADVYRDWSVNLDLGYSMKTPLEGPDTTSTSLRLSSNITPHPRLNFTVDYQGSYDTLEGGPSGLNHTARFQAFWVPVRNLSLFASINVRDQAQDPRGRRVRQQYFVNWTPFPDGQLNFLLSYNQTIDADDNETRILRPQVNWQINRSTLLTVSFDYGTIESERTIQDLKVVRATFRTLF